MKDIIKRYLVDSFSNYVYFVPIFVIINVFIAGWGTHEIKWYLINSIILLFTISRGYGIFLNKCRKWFKCEPT